MKKPPAPTLDPALLAVLHKAGRSWRVLIVRTGGTRPAITAAREFPAEQADRIDGYLSQQQVAGAVCVLPASAVICRTVPLPNAPLEQLEPALRLQAEAHLLGIAPPHRLAMAVLPTAAGETTRSGMILAWPPSNGFAAPPASVPMRYLADVAALAALLNGQRPTEPALWLDRGDDSVALAVTHANGVIFRATREEAGELEGWQNRVGRIVAETALSVGHTGGFVDNMVTDTRGKAASVPAREAALFLPREAIESARRRIDGAPDDRTWWHNHGIGAGAALAVASELAPLANMRHTPPVEAPSPIRSALEAMSRPRAAATVVLAAIAVLMLSPIVFAGLRLAVLKLRYGNVEAELAAAQQARGQLAVYEELDRQHVWPMTKLLSDIATNAPLGIEFETVRMEGGKDFAISGTVIAHAGRTPAEIASIMRSNLAADRVFTDLSVQWGDANNLGVYKFDITGKVDRPYLDARYPSERDFGAWTHEMRRDGKPAPLNGAAPPAGGGEAAMATASAPADAASTGDNGTETLAAGGGGDDEMLAAVVEDEGPAGEGGSEPGGTGSSRTRPGGSGGSGGAGLNPSDAGAGGTAMAPGQTPPALSADEIKGMDEAQLRKHLTEIAKARPYAKGDPALDERLKNEFNQILLRLREIEKEGA